MEAPLQAAVPEPGRGALGLEVPLCLSPAGLLLCVFQPWTGFPAARAVLCSSVLASDLKSPKPVLEEVLPSPVQAAGF